FPLAAAVRSVMRSVSAVALLLALAPATIVLDNPRVRVFRTVDGSLSGVDRGPGVVISLDSGTAVWKENVASESPTTVGGSLIIVQPRRATPSLAPTPPAASRGSA